MSNTARKRRKRTGEVRTPKPAEKSGTYTGMFFKVATQEDVDRGHAVLPDVIVDGQPGLAVELSPEECGDLLSLFTLKMDVAGFREACKHLVGAAEAMAAAPNVEAQSALVGLFRALTEAAVIAYGRTVATAKGVSPAQHMTRLPQRIINALPTHLRAAHDELMEWRDQSVAHRDAAGFSSVVRATLRPTEPPEERDLLDVQIWAMPIVMGAAKGRVWLELGDHLKTALEERYDARHERLLQSLRDTALDDLYRRAGVQDETPAQPEVV